MNAKKAKKLRQLTRLAAVDENGTALPDTNYMENSNNRKYVTVEKVSGDGKSTYQDREQVSLGTIKLDPRSIKGLYKGLKKKFSAAMTA